MHTLQPKVTLSPSSNAARRVSKLIINRQSLQKSYNPYYIHSIAGVPHSHSSSGTANTVSINGMCFGDVTYGQVSGAPYFLETTLMRSKAHVT